LVCAGGYDPSVPHNVKTLEELKELSQRNGLAYELLSKDDRTKQWTDKSVVFLTDVTEIQKIQLLKSCLVLLYTPSNEHFGIVPVEAMLSEVMRCKRILIICSVL
jgi:alpha-1,3/alpha-1,6-mannosyltransferase